MPSVDVLVLVAAVFVCFRWGVYGWVAWPFLVGGALWAARPVQPTTPLDSDEEDADEDWRWPHFGPPEPLHLVGEAPGDWCSLWLRRNPALLLGSYAGLGRHGRLVPHQLGREYWHCAGAAPGERAIDMAEVAAAARAVQHATGSPDSCPHTVSVAFGTGLAPANDAPGLHGLLGPRSLPPGDQDREQLEPLVELPRR